MAVYVRTQSNTPWLWKNRFRFTGLMTASTALVYFLLFGFGLVPQTLQYQPTSAVASTSQPAVANLSTLESQPSRPKQDLPKRITIPAVGIDSAVRSPASKRVSVLNDYLNRGAVRYPGSGYAGNGNLFVFGHSTSHETVWNQAYKTFNGLEDLKAGQTVKVTTESGIFRYVVKSVKIKENSRAYVPLETNKDLLTISTCDSFGAKEDRVVVRAEFSDFIPDRPR